MVWAAGGFDSGQVSGVQNGKITEGPGRGALGETYLGGVGCPDRLCRVVATRSLEDRHGGPDEAGWS